MTDTVGKLRIPSDATGLRLCKVVGERLVLCEGVMFPGGAPAVEMILRRAAVSGRVGPLGETGDLWADILSADEDLVDTVGLSREAWNGLKNRWMRCKVER